MDFLPVFLDIKDQDCLVIGGGDIAVRKVFLLRRSGGRVTVVAPELADALKQQAEKGEVIHIAKEFDNDDIQSQRVVIAATDNPEINRLVSETAKKKNIPVNVVDTPEHCTFVVPSIIDRDPVIVAVSSGGASPVLARLLRARLESLIPAAYGKLAELASRFRERVKSTFTRNSNRRVFWEKVLQGPIADMIFAGQYEQANGLMEHALQDQEHFATQGIVYLVGGGPGDPDLLTFRALRLMQEADVVVYDRLVSAEVLDLVRRDAEKIYAGKERDKHSIPQEDINHLLVRLAKEGKRVVRLKGGDPFIFGRGGEEIETLAEEGVPFQVVPGITAASGCSAYSGIPLTHRDYSQSCVFVTGHLKDGSMNLNWDALAHEQQTVVIYMGLKGVEVLCKELIGHGLPATTSAALIQQGTTLHQRVLIGDLGTLPEIVKTSKVKAPTLIIVGNIVNLHEKLQWFQAEEETG
ncbi:MAG: siroheme synthase CysG [Gammaproteobacteria bacterium]|nr:MAG: siroheme synthase CysG [Gammaproteobacteria bacterium]